MYLYINGRRVSQFENLLPARHATKSKLIRDLTEDDEVELENMLITGEGASVCLESMDNVIEEIQEKEEITHAEGEESDDMEF